MMKPNACLGFGLAGLALWFLRNEKVAVRWGKIGFILGVFTLLLGLVTTLQYILGVDFQIDEVLVQDFANEGSLLFPGRMSPITSLCFVIGGAALALLKSRRPGLNSLFSVPLFYISVVALVGYLYGEVLFYKLGPFIRISWPSAVCFLSLSLGILFSRPKQGIARLIAGPGVGGITARRLLPLIILLPVILGWIWLHLRSGEILSRELSVAIFVVLMIKILLTVILFTAQKLNRLENSEKSTERRFFEILNHAPVILWAADQDGKITLSEGNALRHLDLKPAQLLGANLFELYAENPQVLSFVRRALAGEQFTGEVEAGGRYYSTVYAPLRDGDGNTRGLSGVSLDLTELQTANRRLKESEERFRQLSENIHDRVFYVFELEPESVSYVSPSYERIWRRSTQSLYEHPRSFMDRVHIQDCHLLDEAIRRHKSGESSCIEYRLVFEDGSVRWIKDVAVPVLDEHGHAYRVTGIAEDITDQKVSDEILLAAQRDVADERNKLEQIFKQSPAAMALWRGEDLIFDKVNPQYQALFGERELIGKPLLEAVPELRGQGFEDLLREVLRTGQPYMGREALARHRRTPGGNIEDRYYDFSYVRIDDSNGQPYGVYDHVVDVTDRVLARKEVVEKSAFLRTMLEQMPMAVVFAEAPSGKLIFANQQIRKVWRHDFIPSPDIKSYDAYIGFKADGSRFEGKDWPLAKALMENRVVQEECDVLLGDGTRGILRIIAAPVRNQEGEVIAGVVLSEDITDRKKGEAELWQAKQEAERANKAKSQFLANMSHEIRTPIGTIMGFADLLNEPATSDAERKTFAMIIERNSQQLLRLIDDILDLSKVEAGKLTIEKTKVSMVEFLTELTSTMDLKAREKGIQFELNLEGSIPGLIRSDRIRLGQILNNLIGNAIKFTDKGWVKLRVYQKKSNCLEFTISDSGIGLSEEQRGRLFQAFGQADSSTTRRFGGSGLGLVLAQRLCEALGGSLRLDWSELGRGSRFVAEVEFELADQAHPITLEDVKFDVNSRASQSRNVPLKGMRIALVEDSADNRALLEYYLRDSGAEVVMAEDGREGVKKVLEERPDAVIMDIQMPKMDGHEATKKLREQGFNKPIIALTAHAMREERERCFASGCTDYLTKPLRRDLLLEVLQRFAH